ncbi:MAG: hypothetical protein M3328_17060, partial [Chloroflexota bacterium]|nr:hypothetical protein [Chloroflexota bacterium]
GMGMVMDPYHKERPNLREMFARWLENDPAAQARLHGAHLTGRIVGWPLNTYSPTTQRHGDRIMLIGDAANLVDPLNGEGIHIALESGQIAARVAHEALRADDLSDSFLARYDQRWQAAFGLDLNIANLYVTLGTNRSLTGTWLSLLRLVGSTANRDKPYAGVITGVLAGVVPTRKSLTVGFVLKTLLHRPSTYASLLGAPTQDSRELLPWGRASLKNAAGLLTEIAKEPGPTWEWAKDVIDSGLSVLAGLVRSHIHARK